MSNDPNGEFPKMVTHCAGCGERLPHVQTTACTSSHLATVIPQDDVFGMVERVLRMESTRPFASTVAEDMSRLASSHEHLRNAYYKIVAQRNRAIVLLGGVILP
jgi:hypothetical protein